MNQAEGEQEPLVAEDAESKAEVASKPRERLPSGGSLAPPGGTPLRPPRPERRSSRPPPADPFSSESLSSGGRPAEQSAPPPPEEEDHAALVPIHVMRVIAIGRDDSEPEPMPPEVLDEDIEESEVDVPPASEPEVEIEPESDPAPEVLASAGQALEIPAPDFFAPEVHVSGEEELESLDDADIAEELPEPPPPKPAGGATKSLPPRPKTRGGMPQPPVSRRRPWWEHLFGDDFARAYRPPADAQVRRQVDFIEQAFGLSPGAVVLDLCCGQGQQAVELAARGYGVVGYDLSVFQLAIAAENAQARQLKINFLQGDVREMAFDQMFDAVLCWDTSFGYFEEEKNLNVAERMFKALRPGGVLLLDVLNRDFAAVEAPNHVWFEGDGCICMDDVSFDWITSRLRVKRSLILDDGRSREVVYSLRLYSLHELGKLLHDVGFRVTQATGDMNVPGVFFGPSSPRIIIRAQKPGS